MRIAPRLLISTPIETSLKLTAMLISALVFVAIAADESVAQSRYSAPTAYAQPATSSSGLFGSLFGGGTPRTRTRSSRRTDSFNYYGSRTGYGRYRTLCVRSCDGYYWPVSYSTTRASFARDAKACQTSCAVPARLFVHRNPGADVQQMVDLKGNAYSRTQNAFRYRKEYVKECRCKPEPWSDEAKQDYAQRETGEPTLGEVKTAKVEEKETSAVVMPASGSYSDGQASRGASRNARRKRYRSNNASRYDGQWWAGSW